MAKKRLSKDQQRKKKVAEKRHRRPGEAPSLALRSEKYKSDKYIPYVHATETGVGQADAISGRRLTDAIVREAMEELVRTMQARILPEMEPGQSLDYVPGQEVALVTAMIRFAWENCFATRDHPGQEALIGILRTLLGSVETFTTPAKGSRGYLSFLEGFLRRAGRSFSVVDPQGQEVEPELPEDPLVDAGLAWVEEGDLSARREFYLIANELITQGLHEQVAEAAQMLMGAGPAHSTVIELSALSLAAQNKTPFHPPGLSHPGDESSLPGTSS